MNVTENGAIYIYSSLFTIMVETIRQYNRKCIQCEFHNLNRTVMLYLSYICEYACS